MELKFLIQTKIQRPVGEVFQAVSDPKKLDAYFTRAASAELKEGTTVFWNFPEFPGDFPVRVTKVIPQQLIVIEGEAHGFSTRAELHFETFDATSTLVQISEEGWPETQDGLNRSYLSCQGWMQMTCSLKAFLEYGINLRKGFF